MIKAVIIDDEPKAIQSLAWELSNFENDIEVTATFSNPEDAIVFVENTSIDCLFLDIEMPTMDGFQFLDQLKHKDFAIIITTAYNEYAIKALKEEAIDYLLKPIDSDDLEKAIEKIKKHKSKGFNSDKFERMLLNFNDRFNNKKITINTDGKLLFLEPDEIEFISSDGNYSTINFINGKKLMVTKKLKEMNDLMPENQFFRIHNSYIINLYKIKEFFKAEGYVILNNNQKIPVSRQRKSEFLDKI